MHTSSTAAKFEPRKQPPSLLDSLLEAAGDIVLRSPTSNLKDGQKVEMPAAVVASAASAANQVAVQGK